MKKCFIIILSLLTMVACSKGWGDDHVPVSYSDGVFSFDYKGERYHQFDGGLSYGGAQGCSAFAMYHAKARSDTLVIKGGTSGSSGRIEVSFMIPFEALYSSGGRLQLSQDNIYISRFPTATGTKAELTFNHFFKGDEYIEGSFSVSLIEDNGSADITNGLFKFRPKPYTMSYCKYGQPWHYSLPQYSNFW